MDRFERLETIIAMSEYSDLHSNMDRFERLPLFALQTKDKRHLHSNMDRFESFKDALLRFMLNKNLQKPF